MSDEGQRVRRQVAEIRARFPREAEENMNHKIPNFAHAAAQAEKEAQQQAMIQHNLDVIEHQARVRAFENERMDHQRRALEEDAEMRAERHAAERQILLYTLDAREREVAAREAEAEFWQEKRDDSRRKRDAARREDARREDAEYLPNPELAAATDKS